MFRRPPRSTRTDPIFPDPTRFRSGRAATRRRREHRCGWRRRGHRRLGKHSMNPVRPEEPLSLSKGRLEGPAQVVRDASSSSRSEEHTSELQSLMRISYAVFCLKKKKTKTDRTNKYIYNINTL